MPEKLHPAEREQILAMLATMFYQNVTQYEMAARVGVAQSTVCEMLKDLKKLNMDAATQPLLDRMAEGRAFAVLVRNEAFRQNKLTNAIDAQDLINRMDGVYDYVAASGAADSPWGMLSGETQAALDAPDNDEHVEEQIRLAAIPYRPEETNGNGKHH